MQTNTEPLTAEPQEHQTVRERVLAVAGWLVDGKVRPECVAAAMTEWQVSRRTAQVYVARAAGRIVKATTFEDPLFALKLSQVQRGKLFQELQELLRDGQFLPLPQWKMKLQTVQATIRLLDSRDRTAAKLVQMSPKTPDSDKGRCEQPRPDASPRASGIAPAAPKETLRPTPPPPREIPATPPIPPRRLEQACAMILAALPQATEHLSIMPPRPKGKAGKDMQSAVRPENCPAPGPNSCALRTSEGANPRSDGLRTPQSGPT